jgi:hypothetical protein
MSLVAVAAVLLALTVPPASTPDTDATRVTRADRPRWAPGP